MVSSMARMIEHFKLSACKEVDDEVIQQACREAGHIWRERELGPVATIRMFLQQILYGNVACNAVPHLARKDVTGASYCEARKRIPLAAFQRLLGACTARMVEAARHTGCWLGHRLLILDGCHFSMPDVPELGSQFGYPPNQAPGCGFPVAHWLAVVHFGTGIIQQAILARACSHDLPDAAQAEQELETGDVVLADAAFCSFVHFALLLARGLHGIFRAHGRLIVDFKVGRPHVPRSHKSRKWKKHQPSSRWVRTLGPQDQIVEWPCSEQCPRWLDIQAWSQMPSHLLLRELRYTVSRPGFRVHTVTLVTTLLDPLRYPKEKLAEAYGLRWTVETCFRHLKTTMRMNVLHCQSVAGVMKELIMFLLVYNLVRMTMLEASRHQRVPVDRISFVDALRWLATACPGDPLCDLVINPHRPGRVEPRCRKRRPAGPYPWLQQPRSQLKQLLLAQPLPA
jgi:Transposase DDE domain